MGRISSTRALAGLFFLLCCGGLAAGDKVANEKIEYLLQSVGQSGCGFIRNGTEHSPEDAESHLRLKCSNGKKWVKSAEQFIERLAIKSSWSNKVYYLRCEGEGPSTRWRMDDQVASFL